MCILTEFQLDLQQRNFKPANISLSPIQLENPIFDEPLLVIQEDQSQEDVINDAFHSDLINSNSLSLGKVGTTDESTQDDQITDDFQCLGKEETKDNSTQEKEVTDNSTLDDEVINDAEKGGTKDNSPEDKVTDNSLSLGKEGTNDDFTLGDE